MNRSSRFPESSIKCLVNAVTGQLGNGTTAQKRRGRESPPGLLALQFRSDEIRHAATNQRHGSRNMMQTQHDASSHAADSAQLHDLSDKLRFQISPFLVGTLHAANFFPRPRPDVSEHHRTE